MSGQRCHAFSVESTHLDGIAKIADYAHDEAGLEFARERVPMVGTCVLWSVEQAGCYCG
jgi:hypothetical protein